MHGAISRREALGQLLRLGAGAAALGALGRALAAEGEKRPNILYIMADDHAYQALSCYGSRINTTPNLDRLAAQGMRLENCFVTNSICGPSRATLLTGKYSHMHGFVSNGRKFNGGQPTFIKELQKAGYQTAVIGKWHLETDPQGFDYWNILPGQGAYMNPDFIENGVRKKMKGYVVDVVTDLSIEYMRKCDKSRPFCLLMHHNAPHRNWITDEKHAKMYEDVELPLPPTFDDDYSGRGTAAHKQEMTVEKHLTPTDLKQKPPAGLSGQKLKEWKYQRFIKDYLRVVAAVDDSIGRVMAFLEEAGLAENTIVVYTSDNGFYLGEHGWFDKRFMYEESLRVPFLIRYPGKIKAGTTSKDLVINADYAPTFLDYAGIAAPSEMQGRSIRPVVEGKTPGDWRKSVYYHYYEFPQPHHVYPHYGVRTERYKLIYYYTLKEWEMFDLQKDSHELKSVYDDPGYGSVREEMKAELERLRRELKDVE